MKEDSRSSRNANVGTPAARINVGGENPRGGVSKSATFISSVDITRQ